MQRYVVVFADYCEVATVVTSDDADSIVDAMIILFKDYQDNANFLGIVAVDSPEPYQTGHLVREGQDSDFIVRIALSFARSR